MPIVIMRIAAAAAMMSDRPALHHRRVGGRGRGHFDPPGWGLSLPGDVQRNTK